ncbi:hypothetical protein ABGB17_03020 [Sphaerisporangium sp. B11E5]|uniref:hypothetical protein n=1 Tax=Sphaerisporangium sp. B11E5 TaxID=3153563 RepID=UPI00325C7858
MNKLLAGIRTPSTLGSLLHCLAWGNVRQIEKVPREVLARPAAHTPLLPAAGTVAFLHLDAIHKCTYGSAKQGAGFGHTKIGGRGPHTAFASKNKQAFTARLIVRRVKRLSPHATIGQGELFQHLPVSRDLHRLPVSTCPRPNNSIMTTRSWSRSSPTWSGPAPRPGS